MSGPVGRGHIQGMDIGHAHCTPWRSGKRMTVRVSPGSIERSLLHSRTGFALLLSQPKHLSPPPCE
jgi:hypothetical protein